MNIGELFVNLGIKGTEKTVAALSNVRKGLGDVSSMSIEAKAGILAALYGLERLSAASGAMGTNLTNFTALTGMSAKALQQWQYAARQAGVSGDEMAGSLKSVQNSMTNMLLGKGAPEGLGLLASKVGFDINRARDSQYVLGQLQKFSQSVAPDIGNNVLKSFGLGEGVIAAMRRNAFTPQAFGKAPTYSDREVHSLDRANIAWSNLGNKIEMAVGHFNARHGGQLVKDISMITDKVLKLAESFTVLAEKLKVFQWIGKAFEGWGLIFDKINESISGKSGGTGFADALKSIPGALGDKQFWSDIGKSITPNLPGASPGKAQNNTFNQNFNFQHDGKDHKKTGDSVKKSIHDTFRQMPAQGQGS